MSIVTAAYLAALTAVGYALWQMLPHERRDGHLLAVPTGWAPGVEASEASQAGELTAAIERIEADPDTPAMRSPREERAIDEAMLLEFNLALSAALILFREGMEPVRRTLKAWHPSRAACSCCQDTCACHAIERAREHAAA